MLSRRSPRIISIIVLCCLMLFGSGFGVPLAGAASAQAACITFPETGKQVCGRFLEYWQANGGLAQQGLPLTNEFDETNPTNNKVYKTQYFERARFESHPENAAPYDVLLGLLGNEQLSAKYGGNPPSGLSDNPLGVECVSFPETSRRVCGVFLQYWRANGGLAQQGLPKSDLFIETNPTNGKQYPTQYFERARFEYHVENTGTPYIVLLGLLGREQFFAKYPNGNPGAPNPGGNVIFQDDFTNPNSGWPILNDPQGRYSVSYLPGEYRIAIAAANYLAVLTNAKVTAQSDVRVEVDTQRFGTTQDSLYGLACRNTSAGAYLGLITPNGQAAILKVAADGSSKILGTATNPVIRQGSEINRLRFDCVGSILTLYVNGTQVLLAQDGAFGSGRFAVVGFTGNQGGLDLHLRNFALYRP